MHFLRQLWRSFVCAVLGHDWDPASGTVKLNVARLPCKRCGIISEGPCI